ncbi:MAG: hypothetical protein AAF184_17205 [Pseudomonadota bacterium]
MALIRERMADGAPESAQALLARHPQLTDRALLSRWYSPARLASAQARAAFVLPDRIAR